MRLRQICFVASALRTSLDTLTDVLGLGPSFRDSAVEKWGLENAVVPLGGDFLEIVAPTEPGTSAGRYLDRRGGDGGYMVILHTDDALRERARIKALGVRAVWEADRPTYVATHFHPRDIGGPLLSIDSTDAGGDYSAERSSWPPAGPDWRENVRTDLSRALVGAEIQAADPAAMAARWSEVLALPVAQDAGGHTIIRLEGAVLRFVAATDGRGDGLGGIDVATADRDEILRRAEARGCRLEGDRVLLCGCRVALV